MENKTPKLSEASEEDVRSLAYFAISVLSVFAAIVLLVVYLVV